LTSPKFKILENTLVQISTGLVGSCTTQNNVVSEDQRMKITYICGILRNIISNAEREILLRGEMNRNLRAILIISAAICASNNDIIIGLQVTESVGTYADVHYYNTNPDFAL